MPVGEGESVSRGSVLRGAGLGAVGLAAAMLGGAQTAGAATAGAGENPHVRLIRRYYEAYGTGDLNALRPFFAPDVRWTIPGHHPLSGTKEGIDEVLAFFRELGRAGFRAETLCIGADGDWVIDLHRGWSTTPEGLDITWALAFRIRNRKIAEAINFAGDQHLADAFFWRNYPLAPLPDRLAERK